MWVNITIFQDKAVWFQSQKSIIVIKIENTVKTIPDMIMNILAYFYCYLLNPIPLSQTCIENNSPNSSILCSNLIFFHTFVKILTKSLNFNVLSNFWVYLSKVTRKFVLIFNDVGKSPLKAKFYGKIRQASRHLSKQTNYIWNRKAMVSPVLWHERTCNL